MRWAVRPSEWLSRVEHGTHSGAADDAPGEILGPGVQIPPPTHHLNSYVGNEWALRFVVKPTHSESNIWFRGRTRERWTCPRAESGVASGSRGRADVGAGGTLGVTRLTARRIEWLIRQAQGKAPPRETLGLMATPWGVTPRWLRPLLQRWRPSSDGPRLNRRRRPPEPPLTDEQKRRITEEGRRAPRDVTKLPKAFARPGVHIPKMPIYRFGKA